MNILENYIFSVNKKRLTLPELLAGLDAGTVSGFPHMRAHHRAPLHMFLCQLGAMVRLRNPRPTNADAWREGLLALSDGDARAWDVIPASDDAPGFLQAPDPGGLKWELVETPDRIDLPYTSKNHDIKQAIAHHADLEDWVLALIALQTSNGNGGRNNYGIARMNGGISSRVLFGLAPGNETGTIDLSAWWRRDVDCLVSTYTDAESVKVTTRGGHALLWVLPWPDGRQIPLKEIDPYAIEICRRIRFHQTDSGFEVFRSGSSAARVDAKAFAGVVDDPWAPIDIGSNTPKSFSVTGSGFTYKKILDLLDGNKYIRPRAAELRPGDASNMLIVAEAIARGQGKTEGLHSRVILMPKKVHRICDLSEAITTTAAEMLADIGMARDCLRDSVAVFAQGGNLTERLAKEHYAYARPALNRLETAIDARFFAFFWDIVHERQSGEETAFRAFRAFMVGVVRNEFEKAIAGIPTSSAYRHRAKAVSKIKLDGLLKKHEFEEKSHDQDRYQHRAMDRARDAAFGAG